MKPIGIQRLTKIIKDSLPKNLPQADERALFLATALANSPVFKETLDEDKYSDDQKAIAICQQVITKFAHIILSSEEFENSKEALVTALPESIEEIENPAQPKTSPEVLRQIESLPKLNKLITVSFIPASDSNQNESLLKEEVSSIFHVSSSQLRQKTLLQALQQPLIDPEEHGTNLVVSEFRKQLQNDNLLVRAIADNNQLLRGKPNATQLFVNLTSGKDYSLTSPYLYAAETFLQTGFFTKYFRRSHPSNHFTKQDLVQLAKNQPHTIPTILEERGWWERDYRSMLQASDLAEICIAVPSARAFMLRDKKLKEKLETLFTPENKVQHAETISKLIAEEFGITASIDEKALLWLLAQPNLKDEIISILKNITPDKKFTDLFKDSPQIQHFFLENDTLKKRILQWANDGALLRQDVSNNFSSFRNNFFVDTKLQEIVLQDPQLRALLLNTFNIEQSNTFAELYLKFPQFREGILSQPALLKSMLQAESGYLLQLCLLSSSNNLTAQTSIELPIIRDRAKREALLEIANPTQLTTLFKLHQDFKQTILEDNALATKMLTANDDKFLWDTVLANPSINDRFLFGNNNKLFLPRLISYASAEKKLVDLFIAVDAVRTTILFSKKLTEDLKKAIISAPNEQKEQLHTIAPQLFMNVREAIAKNKNGSESEVIKQILTIPDYKDEILAEAEVISTTGAMLNKLFSAATAKELLKFWLLDDARIQKYLLLETNDILVKMLSVADAKQLLIFWNSQPILQLLIQENPALSEQMLRELSSDEVMHFYLDYPALRTTINNDPALKDKKSLAFKSNTLDVTKIKTALERENNNDLTKDLYQKSPNIRMIIENTPELFDFMLQKATPQQLLELIAFEKCKKWIFSDNQRVKNLLSLDKMDRNLNLMAALMSSSDPAFSQQRKIISSNIELMRQILRLDYSREKAKTLEAILVNLYIENPQMAKSLGNPDFCNSVLGIMSSQQLLALFNKSQFVPEILKHPATRTDPSAKTKLVSGASVEFLKIHFFELKAEILKNEKAMQDILRANPEEQLERCFKSPEFTNAALEDLTLRDTLMNTVVRDPKALTDILNNANDKNLAALFLDNKIYTLRVRKAIRDMPHLSSGMLKAASSNVLNQIATSDPELKLTCDAYLLLKNKKLIATALQNRQPRGELETLLTSIAANDLIEIFLASPDLQHVIEDDFALQLKERMLDNASNSQLVNLFKISHTMRDRILGDTREKNLLTLLLTAKGDLLADLFLNCAESRDAILKDKAALLKILADAKPIQLGALILVNEQIRKLVNAKPVLAGKIRDAITVDYHSALTAHLSDAELFDIYMKDPIARLYLSTELKKEGYAKVADQLIDYAIKSKKIAMLAKTFAMPELVSSIKIKADIPIPKTDLVFLSKMQINDLPKLAAPDLISPTKLQARIYARNLQTMIFENASDEDFKKIFMNDAKAQREILKDPCLSTRVDQLAVNDVNLSAHIEKSRQLMQQISPNIIDAELANAFKDPNRKNAVLNNPNLRMRLDHYASRSGDEHLNKDVTQAIAVLFTEDTKATAEEIYRSPSLRARLESVDNKVLKTGIEKIIQTISPAKTPATNPGKGEINQEPPNQLKM